MKISLNDLTQMWVEDAQVDKTEVSIETARIPNLHAKYAGILAQHNMHIKKLEAEYATEKMFWWEYYKKGADEEDLKARGIDQFRGNVLLKDIPIYLDSQKELTNILLRKSLHIEIVEFCKMVIKELNNRTWQMKTITDWEKFIAGK